jgi:hypothetical protein
MTDEYFIATVELNAVVNDELEAGSDSNLHFSETRLFQSLQELVNAMATFPLGKQHRQLHLQDISQIHERPIIDEHHTGLNLGDTAPIDVQTCDLQFGCEN